MARYIDSSCRLCRRERHKLFLKGTKCFTEKCPMERRAYPPGQHGQSRRTKVSEYGVQLREKQKISRMNKPMVRSVGRTIVQKNRLPLMRNFPSAR